MSGDHHEKEPDFFKAIVEKTAEVIKVCSPDGTLQYTNPAFERIFGWNRDDSIGANVLSFVHPDDIDTIARETEAALEGADESAGPVSNRAVYRFRCSDGAYRMMEALGTYLMEDEAIGGVVICSREVRGPRK